MSVRKTVTGVLTDAATRHGGRLAIRFDDDAYTYNQILERARRAVTALHELGLVRGDRILVMLPNCMQFVDLWLGSSVAGVVQVPVNTEYRGEMLRGIIEGSGASVMVVDEEYEERLRQIALPDRLTTIVLGAPSLVAPDRPSFSAMCDTARPAPLSDDVEEHDLIAVMYTSGTTGPSKGALIAQRHAFEYAAQVADLLELTAEDVYYAPLPLFHIAGQWAVVYATLQRGACAVIKRRFSVTDFWQACAAEQVTVTFLLGAMAQFLYSASQDDAVPRGSLSRVLMVPMIAELEDFRERFGVRVTTCYGSTEVNVPIVSDFEVNDPAVAGFAAPGFQLRVVDEHDQEVPDGAVGELVVRSDEPWVTMLGYGDDAEATTRAFRNLWLHSGDLFRRDGAGCYYFVDRNKDAIRRRGENISSYEVEREVNAHPDVLECAAVAAPSEVTEDEVRVFVVPRSESSLTEQQLREFLEPRMPKFMRPRYMELVAALPKTPTGKIQKNKLRGLPLPPPSDPGPDPGDR